MVGLRCSPKLSKSGNSSGGQQQPITTKIGNVTTAAVAGSGGVATNQTEINATANIKNIDESNSHLTTSTSAGEGIRDNGDIA